MLDLLLPTLVHVLAQLQSATPGDRTLQWVGEREKTLKTNVTTHGHAHIIFS
jgi:hypothetical protein